MPDWQDLNLAKETYGTLCRTLDAKNWPYTKQKEKLMLHCGARGEDLAIDITFVLDPERMLILVMSPMPFTVPEDKRLDTAIAVSTLNNRMAHGCFDFDLDTGKMFYRMCNSFIESQIGEELFEYLLMATCGMVDKYNDKLLMLSEGKISLQQFLDMWP